MQQAAGDELLCELDLAGGELGGRRLGEGAIEEFVVEKLVGDLGEAVGWEDGDGEGEAILRVVVVLSHRGGLALAEFHLSFEAGDAKVLADMKIVEKDFLEGGLGFGGRIVPIAAKFLQHRLRRGFGIVGLAKPVKDQIKLLLHFGGSPELVQNGGVEELLEVFFGNLDG